MPWRGWKLIRNGCIPPASVGLCEGVHNYSKHWPALPGVPIPEFAVAFDSSTAKRLEAIAQENAGQAGTDRRLALAVLSKSFSELQQAVAEDPEVFLSVAERLSKAIQRLEAQFGSARSAEARVLSVLSKLEN